MVSLDSHSGVLSLKGAHEMDNSCIFAINMRPLGSHRELHPSSPSPLLPPPFPPPSPPSPPPLKLPHFWPLLHFTGDFRIRGSFYTRFSKLSQI